MSKIYKNLIKLIKSIFDENGNVINNKKLSIKNATEYDNDAIEFNEWTNKKIKKSLGKDFEIKYQDEYMCIISYKNIFIAIRYSYDGLYVKPYKLYKRALRFEP
jgi:hypothetical protein